MMKEVVLQTLHLVYAAVGSLAVVLALASRRIRRLPVSEPLLALALGVVLGPAVTGAVVIGADVRDPLLLESSRLLLAASVMAAALRFPARELGSVVRPVLLLLVVVMPLAAVIGGAAALLLGLPLGLALLVGACLCPTDPVLAASTITGDLAEERLPSRIRKILTVESGSNDGLALPLVAVGLAVVLPDLGGGDYVGRIAWQVAGGAAVGVATGLVTAWGVRFATRHRSLDRGPELVLTLLMVVAVLGLARVIGTSGVLAVFVCGLVYNHWVAEGERAPQEDIDEAVNRYAVLPLFVLLGVVLPWQHWLELGWVTLLFAVLVLLLRRLPTVLLLAGPLGLRRPAALFTGWFGPMGISALFYLAHSLDEGVTDPRLFAAVTLVVVVSIVAFGVSGAPVRDLFARVTATGR